MREENFELIEDGDKYYELVLLYNAWYKRTCFLSTGNTQVEEWKELLDYCLSNKIETAHFYLELIDLYDQQVKEGTRDNNYVGFFNDIIYECFKDDERFPKFTDDNGKELEFVPGTVVQKFYVYYINNLLDEDRKS